MIKKFIFPLFLFLVGCTSPAPNSNTVKTVPPPGPKPAVPKSLPVPWNIKTYIGANGEPTEKKYIMFEADGKFTNQTVSNDYLRAVIVMDKASAGILLHQSGKSNPVKKFTGLVRIIMKSPDGNELEMTSSKGWNKSGGILIEKNNNDYSRFRIFMLRNKGIIKVEIHDDSSSVYHFDINAVGFSSAFSQI